MVLREIQDNMSNQFFKGKILVLLGARRTGKTTLFRIVVGELLHDKGSLSFPNFVIDNEKHIIKWKKELINQKENL